jgi:elongation factor P
MQAIEVRKGNIIMVKNQPHVVEGRDHRTPGKGNAAIILKVRGLHSGAGFDHRFSPNEKVELAPTNEESMQYLYADTNKFVFMNQESYEQLEILEEVIGDNKYFLIEGKDYKVMLYDGNPISVTMPQTVELKVIEADPAVKSATATKVTKGATVEGGLVMQVPDFIKIGDAIKIDTDTKAYIARVNN